MTSAVDICNRALTKLGAARITSLSDDSEAARACNSMYEFVRDAEFRSHPWNFAIKRAQIAEDTDAPAFGYETAYTVPSDFIRLLPPDPYYNDPDTIRQVEGRRILTDETGALDIRYIYRVTDPNEYDPLFVEMLASRLAMELCETITQSNTKYQAAQNDYLRALREARKLNAFENVPAEPQDDSWVLNRT